MLAPSIIPFSNIVYCNVNLESNCKSSKTSAFITAYLWALGTFFLFKAVLAFTIKSYALSDPPLVTVLEVFKASVNTNL